MIEKTPSQNVLIPVYAIKIKSITNVDGGFATITPEDDQEITDPITVTAAFVEKYSPKSGGYYVMCVNGVGLYSGS